MAGFASWDDLISEATTGGKSLDWGFYKIAASASQSVAGWSSLWTATGSPGAGSAPAGTPGAAYDSATGGITFANMTPDFKFCLSLDAIANQNCTLMLYDRLVGVGGLVTTSTGNKTVSSAALTRYTSTAATVVQAWLEVSTATTATAPAITMNSYTSGDGSSGQTGTAVTFPAAATVLGSFIRLPEAAGKQGVQAVSTINVGTASTLGAVSLVLLRPLAYLPLLASQGNKVNLALDFPSFLRIYDGATLGLAIFTSANVTTTVWGNINLAYG